MERHFGKTYVDVIALHGAGGETEPLRIRFGDGTAVRVERVKERRRAAALKSGGGGIRYTVQIHGEWRFLFEDEGRWFIEAGEE